MTETSVENKSNGDSNAPNTSNGQLSTQSNGENQNGENEEGGRRSFFEVMKGFLVRALFMYMIASYFRSRPSTESPTNTSAKAPDPAINYFPNSTLMDLYVFLSEDELFTDFDNPKALIWEKHDLVYGDWTSGTFGDGSYVIETKFSPSEKLRNNGSIYLHCYVVKDGKLMPQKQRSETFSGFGVAYGRKQLNKYKRVKFTRTQNLLTGEAALSPEEIEQAEKTNQAIISHWHPNITINLVTDQTNWVKGSVPPPLNEYIEFSPTGNLYKPVVYLNDFWNLMRDYQPINDTTESLNLRITYQPLSLFKWQMYCAHSTRNRFTLNFFQDEAEDDDQDSLKEAMLETSPYLLGITFVVSCLHSIFELLAFKNDIQFWNNRKSLEGLSVRLVFFNVFQSLIVMLYVLDNDTNTLIKISCFVGLAIELWKITKVCDIRLDRENKYFNIIPKLIFTDKGSYVQSSTREYDELAFKYLSWVLFPMLGCYSIYSLIYLHHKGWYSWVLNMIYGFLLTFGFIMMTPQLFINYKLKSVAHMPWRMMTYKCLNTFIDDIFAFVINMPTMYRLGCFRDDIVFFIFLYQRWIYKTDPTRLNEFGFSGEMENQASNKVESSEPLKSIEDKKKD